MSVCLSDDFKQVALDVALHTCGEANGVKSEPAQVEGL